MCATKSTANKSEPKQKREREFREATLKVREDREKRGKAAEEFAIQNCNETIEPFKARPDIGILKAHFENLFAHKATYQERLDREKVSAHKAKITEADGEVSATLWMIKNESATLVSGFSPGIGMDQIWVKYDADRKLIEIIVVEAKGKGAKLSDGADKGDQMDARWMTNSVESLKPKTKEEQALKDAMIAALKGEMGAPTLIGKVIGIDKSGTTSEQAFPKGGDYPANGIYNGHYKE